MAYVEGRYTTVLSLILVSSTFFSNTVYDYLATSINKDVYIRNFEVCLFCLIN